MHRAMCIITPKARATDIPSYPLSTSGEIKQFFADEGVKNIPEWYEKIGVPVNDYNALQTMTAVAVRGRGTLRTLYLIKGDLTNNWLEFTTLERSGITKKLPGYQLAYLLEAIGQAALLARARLHQMRMARHQATESSGAKTENSVPAHVGSSRHKHHHKNPPVKVKYLDLDTSTT